MWLPRGGLPIPLVPLPPGSLPQGVSDEFQTATDTGIRPLPLDAAFVGMKKPTVTNHERLAFLFSSLVKIPKLAQRHIVLRTLRRGSTENHMVQNFNLQ